VTWFRAASKSPFIKRRASSRNKIKYSSRRAYEKLLRPRRNVGVFEWHASSSEFPPPPAPRESAANLIREIMSRNPRKLQTRALYNSAPTAGGLEAGGGRGGIDGAFQNRYFSPPAPRPRALVPLPRGGGERMEYLLISRYAARRSTRRDVISRVCLIK